ncbi:MAG TPA: efflux RND transporter periplasmic adaptor subunit [Bryobacteraceae bacterium]|nr:efflux RND transporter periplasmic adaptor subunit [Bryobacteraceae bacterium]
MRVGLKKKMQLVVAAMSIWTAVFVGGCTRTTSAAGTPPPPPEVEVATVEQRDVPIYREWIGTLDGMVNAAIRAQVTGYLLTQNYTEGSFVKKGQLLFQIDPRPFQAAVDQAQGQVAQANAQLAQANAQLLQAQAQLTGAEANQHKAQLDEDRYIPLAKQSAITQQDMDNAIQTNLSAKAQVKAAAAQVETAKAQIQASGAAVVAAKAALETAQVNLSFTRLTAPIDGIAGVAQMQVGNLVNPASNPVTTVSTLDPIKVNFTASEQEYLSFRRQDTSIKRLQLELILSDGTIYPHKGQFAFADRQVTESTGAIQLTGVFPNPGNVLRPGQYGRVRAVIGATPGALLVPQRAVSEMQGTYQVEVVDSGNKVSVRPVKAGERVGSDWIISDGLKPSERVIVEGVLKVAPGMQVNPKPFKAQTETTGGK